MSATHHLLRAVLRFGLDLYYLDIQVLGSEAIPERGPLLIAANHPNSLMDTLLLSTQTSRRILYLARSGLFATRAGRVLFRWLGAIPVYRRQDLPEDADGAASNEGAFREAITALADGGCVGIFPEGRNSPNGQVVAFRTGAARLALQAEAEHDFQLGLRVLPVGIHFERREQLFTGVLIRVGRPIEVASLRPEYEADPVEAARALTQRLQDAVRREALHIEDARRAELAQALSDIIGERLITELMEREPRVPRTFRQRFVDELRNTPYTRKRLDQTFQVRQYVGDVLDALARDRPAALSDLSLRVGRYRDHVQQARIRQDALLDQDLSRLSGTREAIRLTLYAILNFPVAAFGLIHNLLPWLVVRTAIHRVRDEAVKAVTLFTASMFAYPSFYVLLGWLMRRELGWPHRWIAVYLFFVPVTGFFWLRYRRQIARYRQRILARTLFHTRGGLLAVLARERRRLLTTFRALAETTDAALPGVAAALRPDSE